MDNDDPRFPYPRYLRVPFIFVPHGAPPPLEWMAEHPGWVKFPATLAERDIEAGSGHLVRDGRLGGA